MCLYACSMTPSDPATPYRLSARIEQSAPAEFDVVVTAMPENGDPSLVQTLADTRSSRDDAIALARGMLQKMGDIVRNNEGRVIDVKMAGGFAT